MLVSTPPLALMEIGAIAVDPPPLAPFVTPNLTDIVMPPGGSSMPLTLIASEAATMELASEVENGTAAAATAWPGFGIGKLMSSVCTVSALCLTPILMMKILISPPASRKVPALRLRLMEESRGVCGIRSFN